MLYPLPENEVSRLQALEEFHLPDDSSEPAFDDLAELAADICETPMAAITVLDENRQWFKSRVGVEAGHTPRDVAFCNYTICQDDVLIVPDAQQDERFAANPLVTGEMQVRFYAGAPLATREGHVIGTLCVLDRVPRELTERQVRALRVLSGHVSAQFELRRLDILRRQAEATRAQTRAELERRVAQRTAQLQIAVRQAETAKLQISNMVERMSDGMVALDPQWRFDYVNWKAAELIGRDQRELLGQRLTDIFPRAASHPFFHECQEAVRTEEAIETEVYYEKRNVWFEVRCYPSKEGISIFFQDITKHKDAEEKLNHERALSETVIASLPGTFYLFDEQGKYLRWNDQAEAATGFHGEAFRETHPLQMIAPQDHATVTEAIERTFQTGVGVTEARLRHHESGEDRWHLLTGRYIQVEGRNCLLGIGIDISDRKSAELALEDARSRLQVAVRASGIGFWRWEIATSQLHLSAELKGQLGFEREDSAVDVEYWMSLIHPDDRARVTSAGMRRMESGVLDDEQEYRIRHQDGHYCWIMSRSRLFCDAHGKPERIVGCHINITERRKTEEALRASEEQLRALAEHLHSVREEESGRIARELHDEMGASLTALKMDLAWLGRKVGRLVEDSQREPLRERLDLINQQVDGTLETMRKICHALRPAVLDQLGLASAIDWQCGEFQTRSGVPCEVERDESFEVDSAKSTAAFRILQELLTNVTRHAYATRVVVIARCWDKAFHLTVSDNGCGLPPDAFSRHHSFGLVGIRERALAAGGRAEFEPTLNGGTTVRICIPIGVNGEK